METKIIKSIDRNGKVIIEAVEEGAMMIKKGELVAFPTETVYGLGADCYNENAVKKIFEVKGRPPDNPLIVHISEKKQVNELSTLEGIDKKDLEIILENFFPGPLTIILPKKKEVPPIVTGGLDTVAVRYPLHPVAQKLITLAGTPIPAPSANTSGKPSPTTAKHVYEDLKGKIPLILDGGKTNIGIESTVLDLTEQPYKILRPGYITAEDIEKVLKKPVLYWMGGEKKPKSPGMKYKHYAPNATLLTFHPNHLNSMKHLLKKLLEDQKYVGLMILEEDKDSFLEFLGNPKIVLKIWGNKNDFLKAMKNLYNFLRELDKKGVEYILVEGLEEIGLGIAIMNRLKKASQEIVGYYEEKNNN